MDEIINKVAQSKLVTIDLEDYYPAGERVVLDIKDWLYEEIILKEKDFRNFVKEHQWSQYSNQYVALTCSTDAIIPSWAYLLITIQLANIAKKVVVGNLTTLETVIYTEIINNLDYQQYKNLPLIIKGCAKKQIPPSAYTLLISKLVPVAKSIMYGEACSNVPLYKNK